MEKILNLKDLNNKLKASEKLVLIASAEWCGQCRMAKLLIEKIKNDYEDVVFVEIDVDDNNLWDDKTLNVTQVPTFISYKNKKVINNISGYQTEDKLKEMLESLRVK